MLDLVLINLPKVEPTCPTIGPALLKSFVMKQGFSCKTIDLNIKLFRYLQKRNLESKYFFEDDSLFILKQKKFTEKFDSFCDEQIDFFNFWVDHIVSLKPRYVGLSLLTRYSQSMALKLTQLIKAELPEVKFIWGGPNITTMAAWFEHSQLVDHFVSGDGEVSLLKILKDDGSNLQPGGIEQLSDLNDMPLPDYDDVDWSEYHTPMWDKPIYITGSRGCVRKCSFCDVRKIWPKYITRPAKDIIKEVYHHHQKYDRNTFLFTDSLLNGSMPNTRELLKHFGEFKKINPKFEWSSQWIVRQKKFSPESDFKLLRESGCESLDLGVESFSEHIRYHMGKHFSDEDLDHSLELYAKYGIKVNLMMIVGYPTESEEDHQNTIKKVYELKERGYLIDKSTGKGNVNITFTSTLVLDYESSLYSSLDSDKLEYQDPFNWTYEQNTPELRVERIEELHKIVKELANKQKFYWHIENKVKKQKEILSNDS